VLVLLVLLSAAFPASPSTLPILCVASIVAIAIAIAAAAPLPLLLPLVEALALFADALWRARGGLCAELGVRRIEAPAKRGQRLPRLRHNVRKTALGGNLGARPLRKAALQLQQVAQGARHGLVRALGGVIQNLASIHVYLSTRALVKRVNCLYALVARYATH